MAKRWTYPPKEDRHVERLTSALNLSTLTARALVNRGLTEPSAAQRFLQPSLHELSDPCEDKQVTAAAEFLLKRARSGKKIMVYGDYDADGITATSLLLHFLRFLRADVDFYIPHRVDEGYGLNTVALEELAEDGTEVVVTVDCGVTSLPEAALAKRLGIELLITDHHPPCDERPGAPHVLDPKLPGASFGDEGLAGVGVAFKLAWALGQQITEGERVSDAYRDLLMEALSLVAIGTIADVVPMVGENRVLATYGLKTLAASSLPGLQALVKASRPRGQTITARDVAFGLAPRLNAAGRMGDAGAAVQMLTAEDERHARDLAEHLERQNRLRRKAQAEALEQAEEALLQSSQLDAPGCIVLADSRWHLGVVGLVASRLAERHRRPAVVLNTADGVARGSARSPGSFSLFSALQECSDLLTRFGGHHAAAGLCMDEANLSVLRERMNALAGDAAIEDAESPDLTLDGEVFLHELNADLVRELDMLAPFGQGNPRPIFAATGLRLVGNPQIVGSRGNHLALMVRQNRAVLRAICMGKADWLDELRARKNEPFSLAFEPGIDYYRGRGTVELRAEDICWDADEPARSSA